MPRFVIIDGNAILHRAFHALPPLTNKEGLVLNAVYGFASILFRAIRELKPKYLAVAFDLAGPTFRHKEYQAYKAKRLKQPQELYDQLKQVKELLEAMRIPIFEKEGYEADDLIATLATKSKIENLIVTGDRDTLQLVDEKTKVYTLKKGVNEIAIYDAKVIKERYGLDPEQMIDYKALAGDPSDNIPGVKGIGEKTAADLIQKFGSIENLYKVLKEAKEAKKYSVSPSVLDKLINSRAEAIFSKHLVTLVKNVPLDFRLADCELKDYKNEKTKEILAKWEFGSLLKRLDNIEQKNSGADFQKQGKDKGIKIKVNEVKSALEIEKINKEIKKAKKVAIYLSDDGQAGLTAKLFGLALAFDEETAYYISADLINNLASAFGGEQVNKKIVGHDLKRTFEILKRHGGFLVGSFFDVMIMDYLLDPGSRSHGFPNLVLRYLGRQIPEANQTSLFGVDAKFVGERALELFEVAKILEKELSDKGFLNLYEKIEKPLILILQRMEENGVKIDVGYLRNLSRELKKRETDLTKEIYKLAGQEFNIASPQQLKEILFDKLQIPVLGIRKGKTGLSTAASELEKMRGQHPIIDLIFEYRELAKLQNTYIEVLPTLVSQKDQRVRTTFNQAVTATGRLSSSNPNLQNIPVKSGLGQEIRRCFIAEKGHKLLKLDYSQIELRIIASLADDVEMIKIFKEGRDIHTMTAARVNGVALAKVTPEMRSAAKAINFGIIYGMGPHSLAESMGVSFAEAKEFIQRYFAAFKGVKAFLDETRALAHSLGYVETLLGRRRYLPEINSTMPQLRNAAERMAVNAPIQGTAADLIKMAMIGIHNLFKGAEDIKMLLQVHDELVFEVREGAVKKYSSQARTIMENVLKLRAPVKVEAEFGDNWGEMRDV